MNNNHVTKNRSKWIGLVIKILELVITLFKSNKKTTANQQQGNN